jgi:hypothetical protein
MVSINAFFDPFSRSFPCLRYLDTLRHVTVASDGQISFSHDFVDIAIYPTDSL